MRLLQQIVSASSTIVCNGDKLYLLSCSTALENVYTSFLSDDPPFWIHANNVVEPLFPPIFLVLFVYNITMGWMLKYADGMQGTKKCSSKHNVIRCRAFSPPLELEMEISYWDYLEIFESSSSFTSFARRVESQWSPLLGPAYCKSSWHIR